MPVRYKYFTGTPNMRLGRTEYIVFRISAALSQDHNRACLYLTTNPDWASKHIHKYFPHLITKPVQHGVEIRFPQCGL